MHPPPLPPSPHTHLGNILGSERVRQAGKGLNRFSLCDKMLFDEIVCVNQDKILGQTIPKIQNEITKIYLFLRLEKIDDNILLVYSA